MKHVKTHSKRNADRPGNAVSAEIVDALLAETDRLKRTLLGIRDGMTIPAACGDTGLDPRVVRHLLYKPLRDMRAAGFRLDMLLAPWEQLYCDVFKLTKDRLPDLPPDLEESVAEAMDEAKLTDRQKDVLLETYWNGKTQEEIASKYGVTHSAINQDYLKALGRLRRLPVSQLLRYGTAYRERCRRLREEYAAENRKRADGAVEEMRRRLDEAAAAADLEALKTLLADVRTAVDEAQESPGNAGFLDGAGLSRELRLALERQDVYRKRDLYFLSTDILKSIPRNLAGELAEYLAANRIRLMEPDEAAELRLAVTRKPGSVPLRELDLSPRTVNALGKYGIENLHQLRQLDRGELMRIRGIGTSCAAEVEALLEKLM